MSHYDEFRGEDDGYVASRDEDKGTLIEECLKSPTDGSCSMVSTVASPIIQHPHKAVQEKQLYTPLTYVKKPVRVEAMVFVYSPEGIAALKDFVGSSLGGITKARHYDAKAEARIYTLEDGIKNAVSHIATEGDFIIKGVEGEFYPCKPTIFWKTYSVSSMDGINKKFGRISMEGP